MNSRAQIIISSFKPFTIGRFILATKSIYIDTYWRALLYTFFFFIRFTALRRYLIYINAILLHVTIDAAIHMV